ncbi:aminopeptidase N [Astyanax mexicanus]|uniref:Aminopeptidase n=1 Tax=Astyanax mexicanus TaxID=7994 RepID=A0A8T2LAF9_ASTMX|nr:aminopeptidase N [Astyanax mexicanus]
MGKGLYISKSVGITLIVLAVATIIALSVVFHNEKSRTVEKPQIIETDQWKSYRLPGTLSPQYYNVTLWPRLVPDANGMYIFTGHSGVAFTCVKETGLILIHSNKLNYTLTPEGHHAKLTGLEGAKAPAINKTWLEVETQYLVIQLSETLQVGKIYWLYMEFQGELANDLRGFYRSEYFEDGVKKVVATTQMEPTDARKAFPCFDEPAMKAVFHMTLIHPSGTVALSNGMEMGTKTITLRNQNVLQTKFKPTLKMSTYLVAFVVSEYSSIRTAAETDVLVRIWARRTAIEAGHGDYALSITGRILDFFQSYYNSKYPLPKSDQIALRDFDAGAMENWGLITYRETSLLYDPITSSNKDKEWVSTTIAHELAHMWFGNLVTMKWWNDLWLNEGFATYVSYLGVDDVQPTWNIKDLMVMTETHKAFAFDSNKFSHPLSLPEEEVKTPAQINALFNTITYSKGGAVLRMLSEFLSEPVFARGLSAYLKQFAYGNTVYTDLWGKLQEVVDADPEVNLPATISEIMNRWILQMGFPVVTIDTRTGNITQNHFLSDADSKPSRSSPYNYEWFVPISWMKNGTLMDRYWLLEKNATHDPMKTDSEWLLANVNVSGFYRVNYDPQNWQRLLSQLSTDHSVIPVLNRAQIVDDAFNLAKANIINISVALRTTSYLSEEREYQPWKSATKNLNNLFDKFRRTIVNENIQKYLRSKVQPLFYYFKNITDDWTKFPSRLADQYNLDNAISLACSAGLEDCVNLTTEWYRLWMENPDKNSINPSMRRTVYCNGIAAGGVDEWLFAWKMYFSSSSAAEKERLQYALSCTRYYEILNLYLNYTLKSSVIPKDQAASIICHIADNEVGRPLAWNFIRANWMIIFNKLGEKAFMSSVYCGTKRLFRGIELLMLHLFKFNISKAGIEPAVKMVDLVIMFTEDNMSWMAKHSGEVMSWLQEELA